jgi:hypothetical protein
LRVDHVALLWCWPTATKRSEDIDTKMTAKDKHGEGVKPRRGFLSMCSNVGTRHTVPLGMGADEFYRTCNMYVCYWKLHHSAPSMFVSGSGRPFPAVCVNGSCGQELEKVTLLVSVKEEMFHANTPMLGWCECVCCKRCVKSMPLVRGEWRQCPGCRSPFAHQESYLMYPLSSSGQIYNDKMREKLDGETTVGEMKGWSNRGE